MLTIREELQKDVEDIYHVNLKAFDGDFEAKAVDKLRAANALTLSLVAIQDDKLVGHIAFSPVTIETADGIVDAIGLAPMAVLPEYQRRGIGSKLIEEGLAQLAKVGVKTVFVLGHAEYYPRFGFKPAKHYGLKWEHDCPDDAFMVQELQAGALNGVTGDVRYRPEFEEPTL